MSSRRDAKPPRHGRTPGAPARLQAERLDQASLRDSGGIKLDAIDRQMERASQALVAMRYFEAEKLALRALAQALARHDFERVARVCLPLQEARRQIRQLATDAAPDRINGVIERLPRSPLAPGLYLVQPPLTAMDARQIREQHMEVGVPIFLLTREPLTRDAEWPIAAVGVGEQTVTARIKVKPPVPVSPDATRPSKDAFTELPSRVWFEATHESLGDYAITKPPPADPPAWRTLDLAEYLDALPEHEKLHQALAAEARKAMDAPVPSMPRRRGLAQNPYSF